MSRGRLHIMCIRHVHLPVQIAKGIAPPESIGDCICCSVGGGKGQGDMYRAKLPKGKYTMQSTATILARRKTARERKRNRGKSGITVKWACRVWLIVVVFIVFSALFFIGAVFANGDLDTLARKTLAEGRAVADAGEFLGRVDREYLAEAGREHWCFPLVDHGACVRLLSVRGHRRQPNIDK
jgi:hypothetical protein